MISIENIKAILSNLCTKDMFGKDNDLVIQNVLNNLPDVSNIEYSDELECYIFKLSKKAYRVDYNFRGVTIEEYSELDLKIKKLKDLESEIKEFCEDNDKTLNIELFDQGIIWSGSWQSSSYDC